MLVVARAETARLETATADLEALMARLEAEKAALTGENARLKAQAERFAHILLALHFAANRPSAATRCRDDRPIALRCR